MDYIYLLSSVLFVASTNIICNIYSRKNSKRRGIEPLYNLLMLSSVFICWLVMFLFDRSFDVGVIPYALIFAVCYTVCIYGTIKALKTGSVMLTSLFGQISLIVVSIWGFFFWGEDFTWLTGVGLVLTATAIWLCLYNGKSGEKKKLNFKWIVYLAMVLLGNAGCSIAQRSQQVKFDGQYGNFLMVVATGVSLIAFFVLYLRSDRRDSKVIAKGSWYLPVSSGSLNVLLNLFVIILATSELSPSLIYPTLAVGSLIVTTVVSLFIFKEKMRWWQWVGVALGAIATGILSL